MTCLSDCGGKTACWQLTDFFLQAESVPNAVKNRSRNWSLRGCSSIASSIYFMIVEQK
jgi:hypothetical protein